MPEQDQELVFRLNINLLLKITAWNAAIGPVFSVIFWLVERYVNDIEHKVEKLIPLAMITVLAAIPIAGLWFLAYKGCPVIVGREELRCLNSLGKTKSVRWQDTVKTRQRKILGFPFLLVYAENQRRPVAIPLFLQDYLKFVEAVEERAGTDNVLAIALRRLIPRRGRNRRRPLPS